MLTLKPRNIFIGSGEFKKRRCVLPADSLQASGLPARVFESIMDRDKALSTASGAGWRCPTVAEDRPGAAANRFPAVSVPDGVGWGRGKWLSRWSPWRQNNEHIDVKRIWQTCFDDEVKTTLLYKAPIKKAKTRLCRSSKDTHLRRIEYELALCTDVSRWPCSRKCSIASKQYRHYGRGR